jgi:hypothetical protein
MLHHQRQKALPVSGSKPNFKIMNSITSLVLLAAGFVLFICGIDATSTMGSDFSQFFKGSPPEESIALLVCGVVVAALGAGGLTHRRKSI